MTKYFRLDNSTKEDQRKYVKSLFTVPDVLLVEFKTRFVILPIIIIYNIFILAILSKTAKNL
jgi:hypothetical protein